MRAALVLLALAAAAAHAQPTFRAAANAAAASPTGASAAASAKAAAAAPPPAAGAPCTTPLKTIASTCSGGACCEIKQRITLCHDHTTALATINGINGTCCVVLASAKSGKPVPFCATPSAFRGARVFPPGVEVALDPSCAAREGAPPAPALACTAAFPALPKGYALPSANANGGKLALAAGKAAPWGTSAKLAPCGHSAYRSFTQAAAPAAGGNGGGGVTFSVTCAA